MQTAMLIITHALAGATALLTCLPWTPASVWWIRIWDFPRLQIALLALVGVALHVVAWNPGEPRDLAVLVVLVAVCGYQVSWVLPYTRLSRRQVASAASSRYHEALPSLSILISNVLDSNRHAHRLLALIDAHDPDIVFTVESDAWWIGQLAPAAQQRPHTVLLPSHDDYSMALYSRLPLHDVSVRELSRPGIPSIRATVALRSGESVVFYGLHPPPPFPGIQDESTPRDAELVTVAKEIESLDRPVIVAGDLNDVAWSHTSRLFQRISRMRDPRVGRGMYNSFHADYPFARWPLDHIFVSQHFALISMKRLPAIGSDHFPILARLALLKAPRAEAEAPDTADAGDRQEAEEILEQNDRNR